MIINCNLNKYELAQDRSLEKKWGRMSSLNWTHKQDEAARQTSGLDVHIGKAQGTCGTWRNIQVILDYQKSFIKSDNEHQWVRSWKFYRIFYLGHIKMMTKEETNFIFTNVNELTDPKLEELNKRKQKQPWEWGSISKIYEH